MMLKFPIREHTVYSVLSRVWRFNVLNNIYKTFLNTKILSQFINSGRVLLTTAKLTTGVLPLVNIQQNQLKKYKFSLNKLQRIIWNSTKLKMNHNFTLRTFIVVFQVNLDTEETTELTVQSTDTTQNHATFKSLLVVNNNQLRRLFKND